MHRLAGMHILFALALLLAPITRFPGYFHLVAPVKAALYLLVLVAWLACRAAPWARTRSGIAVAGESGKDQRAPWLRRIDVLFLAIVAWICLTSLLSPAPLSQGAGVLLAHVTIFAFFYAFLDLVSRDARQPWWLVRVLVVAAAAVGSLAILQYVVMQFGVLRFLAELIIPQLDRDLLLGDDAQPLPAWGYRSWGTFHHPNLLGIFLALALPIAAILPLVEKRRLVRGLAALAALSILGGIFCSGSRGAWLNGTAGAGLMLLVVAKQARRRIPKAWLLAPLVILPFLGLLFHDAIRQYFRLSSILSNRDIIWQNTWTLVTENPWFGTGPGTFSHAYLHRFGFPSEIERATALRELASFGRIDLLDHWHAHNLLLHYAAEMGLLGALLVLLVFVVYFRELFSIHRHIRGDLGRHGLLVAGCSAAVAGNLVHGLTETTMSFSDPALGIPFVFVLAVGLGAMQQLRARSGSGSGSGSG